MSLSTTYREAVQSVWAVLLTECQNALDGKGGDTRVTMRARKEARFALGNSCGGGEVVVRRDGMEACGSALFNGVASEAVPRCHALPAH